MKKEFLLRLFNKVLPEPKDLDFFETYTALSIISVVAMLPHIFLLGFFATHSISFMVWINVASIAVYAVAFWLAQKGVHQISAILMTLEVCLYGLITTYFLGTETLTQWYILMPMIAHYLFSDVTRIQRIALTVLCFLALNGCFALGYFAPPIYGPVPNLIMLRVLNINVVFFAMLLELWISNSVRALTKGVHQRTLREVQDQSFRDPLTQLFNRRFIDTMFQEWIKDKKHNKTVLVIIDLDEFKSVNDRFGHVEGDRVLRAFADGMRAVLRHTDLQVRWGGDEFVLVMNGVTEQRAVQVLRKLQRHFIENPMVIGSNDVYSIDFSAGVCFYNPELGLEGSLRLCDQCMYIGKREGKGHITCESALSGLAQIGAKSVDHLTGGETQ